MQKYMVEVYCPVCREDKDHGCFEGESVWIGMDERYLSSWAEAKLFDSLDDANAAGERFITGTAWKFLVHAPEVSSTPHTITVTIAAGAVVSVSDIPDNISVRVVNSDLPIDNPESDVTWTNKAYDYMPKLQKRYGYWGSHPKYPVCDWRYEVYNDDTRAGYWDWVQSKVDQAKEESTPKKGKS